MKVAKETWVIFAIGLADLITTIIFIKHHGAREANPIFRRWWEMGVPAFVFAKVVLLVAPLSILEWARRRNPVFVSWALRGAIVAYVGMYGIGFVKLNSHAAHADEIASAPAPEIPPLWGITTPHASLRRRGQTILPIPAPTKAAGPQIPSASLTPATAHTSSFMMRPAVLLPPKPSAETTTSEANDTDTDDEDEMD